MILPLMILPKMRRFRNSVFFAESLLGGVAGALFFRQNNFWQNHFWMVGLGFCFWQNDFLQNDYSLCLLGWALFWVVLCGYINKGL